MFPPGCSPLGVRQTQLLQPCRALGWGQVTKPDNSLTSSHSCQKRTQGLPWRLGGKGLGPAEQQVCRQLVGLGSSGSSCEFWPVSCNPSLTYFYALLVVKGLERPLTFRGLRLWCENLTCLPGNLGQRLKGTVSHLARSQPRNSQNQAVLNPLQPPPSCPFPNLRLRG